MLAPNITHLLDQGMQLFVSFELVIFSKGKQKKTFR
jgi:hypothetical protein